MRRHIEPATLAIALIACYSCSLAHDQLTFRAKVSDFRRPSNALIRNKQPDDTVEITLPGKLLNPAEPVAVVTRPHTSYDTPAHAASAIVSANTDGDISWIVENYIPSERPAIAARFSDPAAAERNHNYYRSLGKVSITGWTEIRGYTVLFLQGLDEDGDAALISIALSKTDSGWKQTDALQADDTFELVWTALHTSGVH